MISGRLSKVMFKKISVILIVFFMFLRCGDSPSIVYVAPYEGCMDSLACNFDENATEDNGSCEYDSCIVYGCTEELACNYNPNANIEDSSCYYSLNSLATSIDILDKQNIETDSCMVPENTIYISASGKIHYNILSDIAGFQFSVTGPSDISINGGDAQDAEFFINGSSTIIGVSLTGEVIPSGCGILLDLSLTGEIESVDMVLSDITGSEINASYISGCNCAYSSIADCSGVCDGEDTSCNDCFEIPNGEAQLDCNGVCAGESIVCEVSGLCVNAETCSDLEIIQDIIDANSSLIEENPYDLADWTEEGRALRLNLSNKNISTIPSSIENLSQLKQLFLSYNNISFLTFSIGNLSSLEHLYLSSNSIENLPSTIGNLSNLIVLDVESNLISNIPSEIANLSNLETLNFGGNQLTDLPNLAALDALEILYLNNNFITSLPVSLTFLDSLNILNVDNNQLTTFPDGLCDIFSLVSFSVSGNQICDDSFDDDCGLVNVTGQNNQSCGD